MEAEYHGRQIHWQEAAHEVGGRVIVGGAQGERGGDLGVVPGVVQGAEDVEPDRRVENVAVQGISEDLAEHVAAEEVFGNGEGGRQGGGDAESGADGQEAREDEFGGRLEGDAEEGVEDGPGDDLGQAEDAVARIGMAARWEGEAVGAEGFETGRGRGEQGVEGKKGQRRADIEDDANHERGDDFDAEGRV